MKRSNTTRAVVAALACVMSACASAGVNTRPENIAALEQKAQAQPANADAATALGVAYYNAKRYDEARTTLQRVVDSGSTNGAAYLYLGLSNEELKDPAAARAAYEKYLDVGKTDAAKADIRTRLALIARQQLKQDAKQVLAREQQMSEEPPAPRTVAVMPFRMAGVSADLAPLQTALSDMIITDLAVSPAVTSIERVKINAMLDEMLLAQSGLADEENAVRVGRLLKAENVVQGVLAQSGEKELRADATVLNTVRKQATGTFGQNQQVDAIFDLEKAIVFDIFNNLGVTLTAQEREKINENRTGNLVAFLAYGRGLDALDKGNYKDASTFFRQASQLDPSFQRAQSQQVEATQLQQAEATTTTEIASTASPEVPAEAPSAAPGNTAASTLQNMIPDLNGSGADLTPAGTNTPQAPQSTITNAATITSQNQAANPGTSQGQQGGITQAAKATVIIRIPNPTKPGS